MARPRWSTACPVLQAMRAPTWARLPTPMCALKATTAQQAPSPPPSILASLAHMATQHLSALPKNASYALLVWPVAGAQGLLSTLRCLVCQATTAQQAQLRQQAIHAHLAP